MGQLQQAVQDAQNPLAEAELIRAQAGLEKVRLEEQSSTVKAISDQQAQIAKMLEDQRQFNVKTAQDAAQFQQDMAVKLTELELKFGQDVPGAAV